MWSKQLQQVCLKWTSKTSSHFLSWTEVSSSHIHTHCNSWQPFSGICWSSEWFLLLPADVISCTVSKLVLTLPYLWIVVFWWYYDGGYQYFRGMHSQSTFSLPRRPQTSHNKSVFYPSDKVHFSIWVGHLFPMPLSSVTWDGNSWSSILLQYQMHCNLNLRHEAKDLI